MKTKIIIIYNILIILISNILFAQNLSKSIYKSDPINRGFVFVDGKYIDAPYVVEAKDFSVYINGVQIKRKYEWPVINEYEFDHHPGIPSEATKYTTFEEARNLCEPTKGITYATAVQWYLFGHYDYDIAFQMTLDYYRSLPYVKSLTKDSVGCYIIENYSGEKHSIFLGGPWMKKLNRIWGPNGTGPPKRKEIESKCIKSAEKRAERLIKGDLFMIFSNDQRSNYYEKLYTERRSAEVLPFIIKIMKDNITNEEKIKELITCGIFNNNDSIFCRTYVRNYNGSKNMENRINDLREQLIKKYGKKALIPIKKKQENSNSKMENNNTKDSGDNKQIGSPAYSPNGISIYAACPYTWDYEFIEFEDEVMYSVRNHIADQFNDAEVYMFFDDTDGDSDCGSFIFSEIKNHLCDGSILYWASHGEPPGDAEHERNCMLLIVMETWSDIDDWCGSDDLIYIAEVPELIWPGNIHPYVALAFADFPYFYWQEKLTESNAITILSSCYSYTNGWVEACGGGATFGYDDETSADACETNNDRLLKRMNGIKKNGEKRRAYEAYNDMPKAGAFKMVPFDANITLCPAREEYYPKDGSTVGLEDDGFYIVDTYCEITNAEDALKFEYDPGIVEISEVKWDSDTYSNRITYHWSATDNATIKVTVDHTFIESYSSVTQSYPQYLDENGIAPNQEDGEFIFYVSPDAIDADFEASGTIIQVEEIVNFTNLSSGDNLDYEWTFEGGDPSSSDEENPSVQYNTTGHYDVTLRIDNQQGTIVEENKTGYIIVEDNTVWIGDVTCYANPGAGSTMYTGGNIDIEMDENETIWFRYEYDFGDGDSYTEIHTSPSSYYTKFYDESGDYNFRLEVYNDETNVKLGECYKYISVVGTSIHADIQIIPSQIYVNQMIRFYDESYGTDPDNYTCTWFIKKAGGADYCCSTPVNSSGGGHIMRVFNDPGQYTVRMEAWGIGYDFIEKSFIVQEQPTDHQCVISQIYPSNTYLEWHISGTGNPYANLIQSDNYAIVPTNQPVCFTSRSSYNIWCEQCDQEIDTKINFLKWKVYKYMDNNLINAEVREADPGQDFANYYAVFEHSFGDEGFYEVILDAWYESYVSGTSNYSAWKSVTTHEPFYDQGYGQPYLSTSDALVYAHDSYCENGFIALCESPANDDTWHVFPEDVHISHDDETLYGIDLCLDITQKLGICHTDDCNDNIILDSNTKLKCRATEEITIYPGFETNHGAEFLATIEECPYNAIYAMDCGKKISDISYNNNYFDNENITNENDYTNILQHNITSDHSSEYSIKVYPNPTPGNFTLVLSGIDFDNSYSFEITNMIGGRIYKIKDIRTNVIMIDISDQPKGAYLVKINTGNRIFTEKIIYK